MSKEAVSEQVGDASCLESEHVCTSPASFASLVPPTAGVQRGWRGAIRRVLTLCRGFGGCCGRIQCAPTGLRRHGASSPPVGGEDGRSEMQDTSCRGLGCPQILFFSPPKIVDPPQEEWGIKGVEKRSRCMRAAHWIPAPRFHEDKLRGNDTERAGTGACSHGVQGHVPAEGLGVPPNSPISPQDWGPGG
jgi:hypothetical protein